MSSSIKSSINKPVKKTLTFKMLVLAGKATPAPPVGPLFGQLGLKAVDFCKQFNDKTKDFVQGVPLPLVLFVNYDKTFKFEVRPPQASYLLKQASKIEKGSSDPHNIKVGKISLKAIYEIARIKHSEDPFMKHMSLRAVCKSVMGTAHLMGLEVVP